MAQLNYGNVSPPFNYKIVSKPSLLQNGLKIIVGEKILSTKHEHETKASDKTDRLITDRLMSSSSTVNAIKSIHLQKT